jgi:hypothetical protein
MSRPIFLLVAVPQFLGAFGHAYLGERDIFPKLTVASTGLQPSQLRVLRVTWYTVSLTFGFISIALTALALKRGKLNGTERWIVIGISAWYTLVGIASVGYWDHTKPQPWFFLINGAMVQLGLRWTP